MKLQMSYRKPGILALLLLETISLCPVTFALKYAGSTFPNLGKKPEIQVTNWLEAGEQQWVVYAAGSDDSELLHFNSSTKALSISNNVAGLLISCKASYPLEWVADHAEQILKYKRHYYLRGISARKVSNVLLEFTYNYTSFLLFRANYKEFTGKFTCRAVGNASVSSDVYMFWEGISPSYLIQSGETLSVKIRGNEEEIVIPCKVCVDDAAVTMMKSNSDFSDENFTTISPSLSVRFDPEVGFILKNHPANITGHYKCVTELDYDFVFVHVEQTLDASKPRRHEDVVTQKDQFVYFPRNQTVTCCSTSSEPPEIFMLLCSDPTVCQLFDSVASNGIADNSSEISLGKVRRGSRKNRSCSSIKLWPGFWGYFQCVGDGVDILRKVYTSLPLANQTMEAYFDWNKIDERKLMTVTVNENYVQVFNTRRTFRNYRRRIWRQVRKYRPRWRVVSRQLPDKVYVGESFNFTCRASINYFAHGSVLTVGFEDGLFEDLKRDATITVDSMPQNAWHFGYTRTTMAVSNVVIRENMTMILCNAPVFNSTKWVSMGFALKVIKPTPPTFSIQDETLYWTVNDTEAQIHCEASGEPLPEISVTFNDVDLGSGTKDGFVIVDKGNGSTVVTIKQVTHEIHGDFVCTAYNLGGVIRKKISVIVVEPSSHALIITVSVMVSALGLILGAVFVFRFQLQKKFMRQF